MKTHRSGTIVVVNERHGERRLNVNRMNEETAGYYVGKIGVIRCSFSQPDGRVYYRVVTGLQEVSMHGLFSGRVGRVVEKDMFAYHGEVTAL